VARPPPASWPRFSTLVEGDAKIILNEKTGAIAVFDLAADPEERMDLAGSRPDLRDRLLAAFRDEARALRSLGIQPGTTIQPPREEEEILRSLGYVQ